MHFGWFLVHFKKMELVAKMGIKEELMDLAFGTHSQLDEGIKL